MNFKDLKINKFVIIYGWVDSIRNLGKIVFISLRNNIYKIQIVIENKKIKFKKNYCLKIIGKVAINKNKKEIICNKIKTLNKSPSINNNRLSEKEKIKNRLFFLKKMSTKKFFLKKSNLFYKIRKFLIKKEFIEIETPILTNETKEGAKMFKINKKLFLSQSPQIFKQILMISEYEKYFQFAKCFRNENNRSDRQPEFTQLDIETSFFNIKKIIKISFKILKMFLNVFNIKNYKKSVIKYKNCINKYGSEKPDLRIKLFWIKISKKIYILNFNFNLKKKIKLNKNKVKYFYSKMKTKINIQNKNIKKNTFILIFKKKIYPKILEYIIKKICYSKEGYKKNIFLKETNIIFIYDMPMFKKKKKCFHHPFTFFKEIKKSKRYIKKNFKTFKSKSYDLVINGTEVAGGSVRINNSYSQSKIFKILNIEKYFKNFIKYLKYGTPPHLGIAFGIDRILQKILCYKSIRDCIAFPNKFS